MEVLIVVTIVGILAAVVVNLFSNASQDARDSSIKMNLYAVRSQLLIYFQEHRNNYPDLANIANQLTLASDADGNTAAVGTPGYDYGPYLQKMPVNSKTGTATVSSGAIGSSDWYYNPSNGEFRPNDSVATSVY